MAAYFSKDRRFFNFFKLYRSLTFSILHCVFINYSSLDQLPNYASVKHELYRLFQWISISSVIRVVDIETCSFSFSLFFIFDSSRNLFQILIIKFTRTKDLKLQSS